MPIDLIFNAALGLVFAYCARDRVRADGAFAFPAFALVAAFAGIVIAPIALYLFLAHPAWSWLYLVDPAGVPGLTILPVLAALAGAVVAGFYGGARLLRAGRERHLRYGLLGVAVALAVAVALCWGRLGRYGSYAEYHDGRALPLMDVKLGYVLVGVMLGITAAAGLTAVELMRDSRRVRTR